MLHLSTISKSKAFIGNCVLLMLIVLIAGCSHGSDPTPTPPSPDKAVLTFPAQNAVCTSGTVISTTQTSVTLTWNASANTDSYEIDIKNLLTSAITVQTASANQLTMTLLRGTPYSWYVVSKSNSTTSTSQSDTWKFYVAGLGVTSYAPFPATITAPAFGVNVTATANTVNLTWTGSDVDNDIVGYDVYFGTATTPPLSKANVTDMFLNNVTVTSGTTYYWKVITKDSQGNTSDSGVYQFKVN